MISVSCIFRSRHSNRFDLEQSNCGSRTMNRFTYLWIRKIWVSLTRASMPWASVPESAALSNAATVWIFGTLAPSVSHGVWPATWPDSSTCPAMRRLRRDCFVSVHVHVKNEHRIHPAVCVCIPVDWLAPWEGSVCPPLRRQRLPTLWNTEWWRLYRLHSSRL